MYEQFVYKRQKEIEKIQQDKHLPDRTYDDFKRIEKLRKEIEIYTKKREDMLRDSATRSKYPLVQKVYGTVYDAKRAVLGLAGHYSSSEGDESD